MSKSLLATGFKDIGKALKNVKPKAFLKLFEEKPKDKEKLKKELEEIEKYVVTGKGVETPVENYNKYDPEFDDILYDPIYANLPGNIYHDLWEDNQ